MFFCRNMHIGRTVCAYSKIDLFLWFRWFFSTSFLARLLRSLCGFFSKLFYVVFPYFCQFYCSILISLFCHYSFFIYIPLFSISLSTHISSHSLFASLCYTQFSVTLFCFRIVFRLSVIRHWTIDVLFKWVQMSVEWASERHQLWWDESFFFLPKFWFSPIVMCVSPSKFIVIDWLWHELYWTVSTAHTNIPQVISISPWAMYIISWRNLVSMLNI